MKIKELHIKGFKSIDNHKGQTIPLGDVTVLLGANGSGKSNVVSFFKMLNYLFSDKIAEYCGKHSLDNLLFYGSKRTKEIDFSMIWDNDNAQFLFDCTLLHGERESLFVGCANIELYNKLSNEKLTERMAPYFKCFDFFNVFIGLASKLGIGISKKTSKLKMEKIIEDVQNIESDEYDEMLSVTDDEKEILKHASASLLSIGVYQFHDTSDTSYMKSRTYVDDASFLRSDARNLAAFLKMLKESEQYNKYYKRIVHHIQQIIPQFGDFSLETLPNNIEYTRLNWYEKNNSDYLFGPHQLSDGSLRFIALTTLLLQPPDLMPSFIVIDEPELGLHPSAIVALAGMIRMASKHAQVLVATQSALLVDEFSLEDLVIVERDKENNCSIFKKLDAEKLKDWLAEYSLSELWEKNVLGGKP